MKHIQVVYLGEPNKIGMMLIKSLVGAQNGGVCFIHYGDCCSTSVYFKLM